MRFSHIWLAVAASAASMPRPAQGEPTPSPTPAEQYFTESPEWKFKWGTDTTLAVSNIDNGSTNETNDRTTNFDSVWTRLYGRVVYKDSVELLVDLFSANGITPGIFGLYGRLQPRPWAGLRVGILPLTFGGWQERAYPSRQPLINQPLFAQYLLPLRTDAVPKDVGELLAARDTGLGTRYGTGQQGSGGWMTLAYEHCWDTGVEGFGQWGGLRYRLAVMDAPPGSPATKSRAQASGRGLVSRLTYKVTDAFRLGASWARGPYLQKSFDPYLPEGHGYRDYHQALWGADARLRTRLLELHAEWMDSRFESPYVDGQLQTGGYYGEAAVTVAPGVQLAARFSGLQFGRVHDPDGNLVRWNYGITRLETGAAYRWLDDHLAVKAVYQETRIKEQAPVERIYALQLAFSYQ